MTHRMTKFEFSIDRGGTFTDVYAVCPNGKIRTMKLLSVDPANYPDAPREAIRRILEEETGMKMPSNELIDTSRIGSIRMGTTVATNALLERKGERMALAVTKGFRDLLYIGNQARPDLFDLEIKIPELLYEEVIEVEERVVTTNQKCRIEHNWKEARGVTGEQLWVCESVNEHRLREDLKKLLNQGIKSLAVVLLHSYMYPDHEQRVGRIAEEVGFSNVSLSSQVMPMVRAVPRGFTAAADAYLTPCIKTYLENFSSGFENKLKGVNVLFMQSDGGLTPMKTFCGSRAILSGPAGGVVGYSMTSFKKDTCLPVIGFDMGGTSTDVSRFAGEYEHVFESVTAGITMQAPQLDVNTVAAGGGSMLFFRSGIFSVGPQSAGAHPGPVCYRKGGLLAVTDANLCLGRLLPEYFPKIFGPKENEPLDKDGAVKAMQKVTEEVNQFMEGQSRSMEEVALGFIQVANEAMSRPIRALTQAKGYDTRRHALCCFGGAGGQHACSIARALGMQTVLIHRYAGILSAYGIALADVVHEAQEPCSRPYVPDSFDYINKRLSALTCQCVEALQGEGFTESNIEVQPYLHMRYDRTDCAIMIAPAPTNPHSTKHGDFREAFLQRYKQEFGFIIPDRTIMIDDIRVRGAGKSNTEIAVSTEEATESPPKEKVVQVYFSGGWRDTDVYLLEKMKPSCCIRGPAIIMESLSTIVVEPDCTASLTRSGNIHIQVGAQGTVKIGKQMDPIQLSIFSHRFMSLAEQMGRILQRTSVSTNIKERLDFSCALFGPDGGLVSNAPHIPVHLGAMQETVQYQLKMVGHKLKDGDVILSNHPSAGGSHLPDLTVITPVFLKGESRPIFFLASRGHHADIGGITPGSMPPHSTHINQEGAVFKSFFLVREHIFQEQEVTAALNSAGTRNLSDNLSDLRAQVAANQRGIVLVQELIEEYSLAVVQAYMGYIQQNAELSVRDLLRHSAVNLKRNELKAEDFMDDGSVIRLSVDIDSETGSAVFDFRGTGPEVWGNCNAPKAVTMSAVIYCLRSLVGYDIPLNQGCLNPVKVIIPPGSILCPSEEAAVVGGNVLTSQRVVDVVLAAFRATAASQGCMNNVTIGDETWGYYETIAGGAGAGPGWNGRGGIHTHMTNTRITDAEILERRYPVILKSFHLVQGSGGKGKWRGGDGIRREMLFRAPLTLCVLTERRVFAPYGMEGGEPGNRGMNVLLTKDGRLINLGGKTSVPVQPGDMFRLLSPSGGGYGKPEVTM